MIQWLPTLAFALLAQRADAIDQSRGYAGPTSVASAPADDKPPRSGRPDLPLAGPGSEKPGPGDPTAKSDDARGLAQTPSDTPGQRVRWGPRVVLYPAWLLFTAISWPTQKVLKAGKGNFVPYIKRAFIWNRAGTVGWLPHASFISGFGFSYGARVFHHNLFGNKERLQFKALFGGVVAQRYQLRLEAPRLAGTPIWLDLRIRREKNPTLIFRGFGQLPDAPTGATGLGPRDGDVVTRYSQQRILYAMRGGYAFGPIGREFKPGVELIYNNRDFGPLDRNTGDPSTETVYDTSQIPGYDDVVDIVQLNGGFELDFRNNRGFPSRGFFFEFFGGGAPPQRKGFGFGHYSTELTGFINLFKDTRVLVLRVGLEALHGPIDNIPFSELALLGGPYRLRGFHLGRFRDKRSVLGTVEYRYPIHQLLSGHLFFDVGRVGRDYEDLFVADANDWNYGFGGGFTIRTLERVWLRLDLAYGDDFQVTLALDPLQAFRTRSKQL